MKTRFWTKTICAALLCACAPAGLIGEGLIACASAQSECTREWLAGAPIPGLERMANAATMVPANRSQSGREELYVVGFFDVAGGVFAHGVAMWDGFEWHALGSGVANSAPFDSFDVREICVLKNGDVVVAGKFTSAGGAPAPGIARWDGQTWHAMTTSPLSGVSTLVALPSGDLLACGSFAQIDGLNVNGVARWDGTRWHSVGGGVTQSSGATAYVLDARLCADGRVAVCGRFDRAGGIGISNIALLTVSTGTWESPISVVAPLDSASLIAPMPDGGLVVCGRTSIGGATARTSLQRWSPAMESWVEVPLDPGMELSTFRALEVEPTGAILIGGDYLGRTTDNAYGVFRLDGTTWQHVGANQFDGVQSVVQSRRDGLLIVGGVRDGVRKLADGDWRCLTETTTVRPWVMREAPDGTVYAIGASGDYDTEYQTGVYRYGAGWERVTAGFNKDPRTLTLLRSGDIVVSGPFTKVGNVDVPGVARFDGTAWHPVGNGLPGRVNAIFERRDGTIVAGIYRSSDPEDVLPAVYQLVGNTWTAMGEPFRTSQFVGAGSVGSFVEMPSGDLVAGGYFAYVGSTAATGVARWDGFAWRAVASGLGDFNYWPQYVTSLAVTSAGELFAGGYFRLPGGPTKRDVARLRPSLQTWEPLPGMDFLDNDPYVEEICLTPKDDLLVAGNFYNVSNQQMNQVMLWRRATGSVEPLGTGLVSSSPSRLLSRANGDLFVCGGLVAAGDHVSNGFAIWGCRCVADADADGLITFEDFDAFVAAFERGDASADLDGNGFVDIEDFDAFIGVFEHGCP